MLCPVVLELESHTIVCDFFAPNTYSAQIFFQAQSDRTSFLD